MNLQVCVYLYYRDTYDTQGHAFVYAYSLFLTNI